MALKRPVAKSKRKKRVILPSAYKKQLDAVFSKYIRAKYPKRCFTCGKETTTLQCGHFVPRIYLATRWMESNCRPQCVGCNIWGRGQLLDFEENLKKEIGEHKVELIKEARKKIIKLDVEWYKNQIEYYQNKLKEIV